MQKRNALDAAFKLKVIACAEKPTNRGAVANFFCGQEERMRLEEEQGQFTTAS